MVRAFNTFAQRHQRIVSSNIYSEEVNETYTLLNTLLIAALALAACASPTTVAPTAAPRKRRPQPPMPKPTEAPKPTNSGHRPLHLVHRRSRKPAIEGLAKNSTTRIPTSKSNFPSSLCRVESTAHHASIGRATDLARVTEPYRFTSMRSTSNRTSRTPFPKSFSKNR